MSANSEESPLPSPSISPFEQASEQGKYRTVHLRAGFATFSSRLESLQGWPYKCLPRWQLAIAGFFHDPIEEDPAVVVCFSCEVEYRCIETVGKFSDNIVKAALLDYHVDGCLWADMYRNATEYFPTKTRLSQKIGMVGRKHNQSDTGTISHDQKKSNFSIQINRAQKGDPNQQLLILETMSMLLSQNCVLSFSYSN
jgi:Inhibitor of Apoptosis domain